MASVPGQQQPPPISQPPGPPGSQQQPTPSTTTIPAGPSSSSVGTNDPNALSWEGDKMFNIYIYDYCNKRGFRKTAKELLAEAEIASDAQPPINARQGLLFEWWSVFWVLFTAKNSKTGPDDAMIYIENQNQQSMIRQHRQMEARQNQPPQAISQPSGAAPNGAIQGRVGPPPAPNGMPPQGGMPPRNMPNGVGPGTVPPPGSGFQPGQQPPPQQPHLMNGMQPNPGPGSGPGPGPGNNPGQPPNPPFGQRPPGAPNQPPNPNPNARPGQPGQQPYQSPPTAHSPPGSSQGQPLQQRNPAGPQPPGMMAPGQSPHMGPRGSLGAPGQPGSILPHPQGPHGQQSQQGPGPGYPMGSMGNPGMNMGMNMGMGAMGGPPGMGPNMGVGRSPSRSGDGGPGQPGGMNPSPSLANRQPPGGGGNMGISGSMMGGPMGSSPMASGMMGNIGMGGNMMGGGGMSLPGGPMMSDQEVHNILHSIPPHLVVNVKRDANVENKDFTALSPEEKRRVVHIYRTQYVGRPHNGPPLPPNVNNPGMGPGSSNMGPPQGQPGASSQGHTPRMQPGRVAGKRNSATGEEPDSNNTSSPPDAKRRRKSPMEGNTPQNSQQQSPSNYPAQAPGQGPGHNPGPNPGPGPMGRPMPNPGFPNSQPPPQNAMVYRNSMANMHRLPGGPPHMEGGGVGPFNGRKQGPGGTMPPPQSPGMNKDQIKDGIKAEGSPRNLPGQNQGMTPTNPGTASSTPVLSQQAPPGGPPLMGSQPTPQSQGPTPQPGMLASSSSTLLTTPIHPSPQVTDMFTNEFMQSVANQLEDFDSNLFRPDGDINFERDFGQWFNDPGDSGGLDIKP
ncbi:hypothetical protein VNI00_010661 [Paramarasmius palmivorus]|uniref:LisH domain-containing protein n=1 Tax=Paramarasmius palmivorus TaxID=297713 RepID=A0AAW0CKL4_9AGAR